MESCGVWFVVLFLILERKNFSLNLCFIFSVSDYY